MRPSSARISAAKPLSFHFVCRIGILELAAPFLGLYMHLCPDDSDGPILASTTTIFDEMRSAARGVVGLIVGDRKAAGYFDFSDRGLVGSFIAFLAVTGINAALPKLLGMESGTVLRSVAMIAILFGFQIAFSAIVLRQLKRLDGLVPYLVADNWATFFITIGSTALALFGFTGDLAIIVIGLLVIIVEVNIARLIVTLSPLQIAMFLIAQLVGVSIGLILVGMLLPLSPAELAELESLAASTPPL
jgi:hypothetical protein